MTPGHPLEMGPAAARNRSPPLSLVVAVSPPTGIRHPDAAQWYTLIAMERTSEVRRCRGCDSALPEKPPGTPGRTRHWCSDNCRKRTWERTSEARAVCVDCWASLCPSSARKGYERCRSCHNARVAAEHEEVLAFVEWMYNAGRPIREIREELGYGEKSIPSRVLSELREQGRIGYRYKAYEQRVAA
jgi:hypothetical protein